MKYYNLTVSEEHIRLIANAIEDWSRFLAGQCEMYHATSMLKAYGTIYEIMTKEVEPLVGPEGSGSSYGWDGGNCPNEEQKKAIAMSYGIYREILHYFSTHRESDSWSVYNSPTLTCPEQGGLIKIEEKKEWIEKACKWLEANVWGMTGVDYSALSDSFCQAMEEML